MSRFLCSFFFWYLHSVQQNFVCIDVQRWTKRVIAMIIMAQVKAKEPTIAKQIVREQHCFCLLFCKSGLSGVLSSASSSFLSWLFSGVTTTDDDSPIWWCSFFFCSLESGCSSLFFSLSASGFKTRVPLSYSSSSRTAGNKQD